MSNRTSCVTLLCEEKASLRIETQHSKTHLKSYYVEKCLRSRKLAEGEKDFFLANRLLRKSTW